MRVHLIGGGAIGLLLGAKLLLGGCDVTVWTRTQEQAALLSRDGIVLLGDGECRNQKAKTMVEAAWIGGLYTDNGREGRQTIQESMRESGSDEGEGDFHWILLTVKQTHLTLELLGAVRRLAERYGERAAVVCLQNGTGHLDFIAGELKDIPVYAAVISEGAKRERLNEVRHTGSGGIWLGESPEFGETAQSPCKNQQKMLLDILRKAGFSVFLSKNIHNRVFQKLLINSVINPLTALYDLPNGELPKHPRRLALMKQLHAESETILLASGMEENPASWDDLLAVCQKTSGNISSMLGDVRAGRITEIAAINGAIVSLAGKHGMQAPLNRAVADMIAAYAVTMS